MPAKPVPPFQLAPPEWDNAVVYAFQALVAGEAGPDQQRRAIDWIVHKAAATYDQSFHPDNERLTSFAEGRRFVGNQIVKLINLKPSQLKKDA